MTPIERCRLEQKRCRDHILNGGGDDLRGAWLGLSDWLKEELLMLDGKHETQETIGAWGDEAFGTAYSAMIIGARANTEMAELIRELAALDNRIPIPGLSSTSTVAMEAADVLVLLYRLAHTCRFDLHEALDAKMRMNRGRVWQRDHDGTGHHVRVKG